jgi:hypothetical protein
MTRKLASVAVVLVVAACARPPAPPSPAAPGVPIPPPPPRGEPDQFSGIGVDRLQVLLGSPAFIRKDGATEMWRYDNSNCHAFFFLYDTGTQRQVRHVETVPQGKGIAADPVCLNALKKVS